MSASKSAISLTPLSAVVFTPTTSAFSSPTSAMSSMPPSASTVTTPASFSMNKFTSTKFTPSKPLITTTPLVFQSKTLKMKPVQLPSVAKMLSPEDAHLHLAATRRKSQEQYEKAFATGSFRFLGVGVGLANGLSR